MLKELTVKEALQLLAEKYPEPVYGWFWDCRKEEKFKNRFIGLPWDSNTAFVSETNASYFHFAIEVEPEYRYMTQQECINWVCLHGLKGYQVQRRGNAIWRPVSFFSYESPCDFEYRTIQEIDGKIVYGEPQEFKVRVE